MPDASTPDASLADGSVPDAGTASDAGRASPQLASLQVSVGALTPTFDASITRYTVTVPWATTSLTITARASDPRAPVRIAGNAPSAGQQAAAISLDVGLTTVSIVVVASDGTTATTTLTIDRLSNGQAVCEASDGGRCLYAAPAGAGDCSYATPCTISAGLAKAARGDFLYLRAGTYSTLYANYQLQALINLDKYFHFQASPVPTTAPLVIKAYPGEHALLHGDDTNACVFVDTSNVVIDGLEIEHCWEAGVRLGADVAIENVSVQRCDIHDIVCNDNMGSVYVQGASNVLIDSNTFHDDYYAGTQAAVGTASCKGNALVIFRAHDVTISGNDVYRTCGGLYYKHGEAAPDAGGVTRIIGNHFHDFASVGVNQNRTEVRRNVIEDTLWLHNEDGTIAPFTLNVVIANNTFVHGQVLFPAQGGSGKNYGPGQFPGPIGVTVSNNVFYDTAYTIWPYGSDAVYDGGIDLTSDSNCFFAPGHSQSIRYFGGGSGYGSTHGGSYGLGGWQGLGFDHHSLEMDPLLALDAGFHLGSGSPCAAMGAFAP